MGRGDKIGAATDEAVGPAENNIGAATDRPALRAAGRAQNAVGHARQPGHDVEDAVQDIVDDE